MNSFEGSFCKTTAWKWRILSCTLHFGVSIHFSRPKILSMDPSLPNHQVNTNLRDFDSSFVLHSRVPGVEHRNAIRWVTTSPLQHTGRVSERIFRDLSLARYSLWKPEQLFSYVFTLKRLIYYLEKCDSCEHLEHDRMFHLRCQSLISTWFSWLWVQAFIKCMFKACKMKVLIF